MKTFTLLLLASLLAINNLFAQEQESSELKEASALTASALKFFYEQKYDKAVSEAKKALEIRERLLPHTDSRVTTSLIYLGDIYLAKRDFDEAKKVLERLLQIQAERTSSEDVSLAPTWDRLAAVYYREGDERKAEELYRRALASREKAFGAESARVADSLFALGQFYRAEGDYAKAAAPYRRSLLMFGKLTGIHSPDFERGLDAFHCLSYLSENPEWSKQAREIWDQFAPPQAPVEPGETKVLNGMALSLPKPSYPSAARDRRLAGMVVVKVLIDETGKVIKAHDMCQGPPYLSESSVAAALKARFSPTKLSGMPVKVTGVIQYNFVR